MSLRDGAPKFGLFLVTTALALAGAELVVRWLGFRPLTIEVNESFRPDSKYGWAQFDPALGWRNKPGVFFSNEAGNASMTFWSDGRRSTRPDPTPRRLPQVLFVGCSFTQGYGVPDQETFAYRLSETNLNWDVENFGTGGYGAYQSLLRMRNVFSEKRYSPSLVVYGYLDFHAYRDVAGYAWVKALRNSKGEFFAPPSVTVRQGRLVEYPLATFPRWPGEREFALVALAKIAYLRLRFLPRAGDEEEATKLLLTEMRNLAVENGARFLVMELETPPPSIQGYMNAHAIDSVDCLTFDPTLHLDASIFNLAVSSPSFRVGGTGHPNGKVHRSWAACIDRWLADHAPKARDP
jgi:hypothetical protein